MSIIKKISAYLGILFFVFSIGCGSPLIEQLATPSISQIQPQPIPAGTGDTTLTVVGANFNNQTAILWNGSALATTPVSSSAVSVVVPAAKLAQPGTVQVQVQNGTAGETSVAVPLAIVSPNAVVTQLTIATPTFSNGVVGTSYSATLTASGGTTPYKWSISSGSLPTGLSLAASTGVIAGTPTAAGTFSFGITVTDSSKSVETAKVTASIVITPSPLAIKTTALAAGTNGVAYSQDLVATGGTPVYTWSISSGTLPAGLSLAASTGVISGTPTVNGTFALGLTVKDSGNPVQTATLSTSIVLAPRPVTITTSSLASGIAGTVYSQTLTATGGTPNYSWALTSGSLPAGLSLSTTGVISGTPWTSGTFSFGVTVTDSGSPVESNSTAMMLTIAPRPLSISSDGLAVGSEGVAYSQTLSARGGTAPYTWSLTAGSVLPAGLTLSSSGLISGTPTAGGNFDFGVQVSDSSNPAQTASLSTLIVISPSTLTISTTSLASATQGTAYSQTLVAAGGTPNFRWSITSGSLPAGLSLSAWTGVISGTPTVNGSFTLGVTVTDRGNPQQTATATVSLTVASTPLAIVSNALPTATAAVTYNAALSAAGGTAPYVWSVSSGNLPTGLSMAATGVISGTPAATGTFPVGVMVTDSCKPSALSKSATLTLVVTPSALTITVSTLASGTEGVAYAQTLAATGGTPAYTWSITSGALPAGLTLAATTGVISGTPTATGTSSFTATVTDNGSPAQTQSMATSITVAAGAQTNPGTTWYIRPDGGTRYSANLTSGQCDGKADVAYSGTGTNQHCAFNDYRYLWDDWSYGKTAWVITGGDTVIIRGCVANAENGYTNDCRVGFDQASSNGGGYTWCVGGNGSGDCSNPAIPSGTASQHTRILGQNYASCSANNAVDKTKLTQIFGGYGVYDTLNLSGAQYVDVQCLEVTSHAQCIAHGSPAVPKACSPGVDDYDSVGITTDVNTHDLLLQDLSVHGHTDRGIKGAIGGVVTALRVDIAYNGMAGWDFDDGSGSNAGYGTPSLPGSVWNFNYSTIEWNGCNQIYPSTNADTCYDDLDGAYGDGVGTPPGMCLSANIDHSAFNYNTQDGLDLGHIDTGTCSAKITNSSAIGNMGATFKWGPNENPVIFTDNVALANCGRLSQPIAGTSSYYNQHLQDWCRSGDNVSFNFRQGGTALVANNTVVGYEATSYDINCWDENIGGCTNSTLTFENNLTLGYDDPLTYNIGGQAGGVGGIYFQNPIGTVTRSNNLWYGMRASSFSCPTGYTGEACEDPLLVNEPTGRAGNFVETELDNFNFSLTSGSPAIGAGVYLPSVQLDYTGAQRSNPPSIGAYEQ